MVTRTVRIFQLDIHTTRTYVNHRTLDRLTNTERRRISKRTSRPYTLYSNGTNQVARIYEYEDKHLNVEYENGNKERVRKRIIKTESQVRPPLCSTCISLTGGGYMNFNGLFHKFSKEDSRPKYVSFRYRVSKTQPVRGFFNVFLSSATEPYEDVDVFHLGRPRSLLDMSCLISTDGSGDIEVWLPTGKRVHLSGQTTSSEDAEDENNKNDWRKVDIYFNWDVVTEMFSVARQGTTLETAEDSSGIPAAPQCWFRLDGKFVMNNSIGIPDIPPTLLFPPPAGTFSIKFKDTWSICQNGQWLSSSPDLRKNIGYNFLYLFHWIERNDVNACPTVDVTDFWIE